MLGLWEFEVANLNDLVENGSNGRVKIGAIDRLGELLFEAARTEPE